MFPSSGIFPLYCKSSLILSVFSAMVFSGSVSFTLQYLPRVKTKVTLASSKIDSSKIYYHETCKAVLLYVGYVAAKAHEPDSNIWFNTRQNKAG
jgi:hypothetical protein